jgi:hypothetical protein
MEDDSVIVYVIVDWRRDPEFIRRQLEETKAQLGEGHNGLGRVISRC